MTNVIAKSVADLERISNLLGKSTPSYRKAYSDRTAWLMACLSELAYIRFNPPMLTNKHMKFIQNNILKSLRKKKKATMLKWLALLDYDHNKEQVELEENVKILGMNIIEMFDCNGTQAILVSYGNFIVLAFRGTEAMSIKDIRIDLDAKTTQCETGGKIHSGFKEAFEEVALDIQKTLNEDTLKDKPLFITGHSLGGALATIAAKKLSHKGGIAACYTFGSPRVGNDEWIADIKVPIYRVVNAADCVTMLPPGDELITIATWILRCLAWFKISFISRGAELLSRWLLSNFAGYLHGGDMRYMTNCKSGQYDDVKLLNSVSLFRRLKGFFIKKLPWGKFLSDHSIKTYRKKLMIIAERRN